MSTALVEGSKAQHRRAMTEKSAVLMAPLEQLANTLDGCVV